MEGSREICDFAVVRMRGLTAKAAKQGARNNAGFAAFVFIVLWRRFVAFMLEMIRNRQYNICAGKCA